VEQDRTAGTNIVAQADHDEAAPRLGQSKIGGANLEAVYPVGGQSFAHLSDQLNAALLSEDSDILKQESAGKHLVGQPGKLKDKPIPGIIKSSRPAPLF